MTRHAARCFADSLIVVFSLFLTACGSGAVSGPAVTTGTLAISPTSAVAYSGVPATFVVTGGTAPYFVSSSNGVALPVPSDPVNYNKVIIVPGDVGADTSATLSVTDAAHSTTVSSTVTIKPQTISNVVTITPNPSQAVSCGSSLCAGGDATVSVKLTQAGVPLANRPVRFNVVSGPVSFIVSTVGGSEILGPTAEATTDASGTATIRVRAGATSLPQTALIDATDEISGATVRAGIAISPSANVPLTVSPPTIAFQGSTANTCASGTSADVIVFGGLPPYSISQAAGFIVSPTIVTSNPGRFTVTATGTCSSGSAIGIVDTTGASTTVTVTNNLSQTPAVTQPPFTVAPDTVTLSSCGQSASVTFAGGTGNYYGAGASDLISVSTSGIGGQIALTAKAKNITTFPVQVNAGFSDGQSTTSVKVNIIGNAGC